MVSGSEPGRGDDRAVAAAPGGALHSTAALALLWSTPSLCRHLGVRMNVLSFLQTVVGTGAVVRMTYTGGSRPGAARDVVVLALQGSRVICAEPPSKTRKTFDLAKIAAAQVSSGLPAVNADATHAPPVTDLPPGCATLEEFGNALRGEFEAAGWHVVLSPHELGVARFFKNGKPRKGCVISIRYFDPAAPRWVWDDATGEQVLKTEVTGRERPYSVQGPDLSTSYRELSAALRRFLEAVRATSSIG